MFCKSLLYLRTCITDGSPNLFTPRLITKFLSNKGIHLAAITDVNTCLNAPAFSICCRRHGIFALYGMEAWCLDKKALVLFSDLRTAMDFSSAWYVTLPALSEPVQKKPPLPFFESPFFQDPRQFCVDEDDSILFTEKKYLQVCSEVPFQKVREQVEGCGGLVFPLESLPERYRQTSLKEIGEVQKNFALLDTGDRGLLTGDETINLLAVRTGVEKL